MPWTQWAPLINDRVAFLRWHFIHAFKVEFELVCVNAVPTTDLLVSTSLHTLRWTGYRGISLNLDCKASLQNRSLSKIIHNSFIFLWYLRQFAVVEHAQNQLSNHFLKHCILGLGKLYQCVLQFIIIQQFFTSLKNRKTQDA